jgi:hypothetical protein
VLCGDFLEVDDLSLLLNGNYFHRLFHTMVQTTKGFTLGQLIGLRIAKRRNLKTKTAKKKKETRKRRSFENLFFTSPLQYWNSMRFPSNSRIDF